MSANTVIDKISTAGYDVDDAVGVPDSHWFVAIVNHNAEKGVAEKLTKLKITNYLPVQTEFKVWKNGRKAKVERVVIPSTIFVKCTEQERREIVKLPYINRFMTNRAGTSTAESHKPLAIIRDSQIETLKFMLNQSDIPVEIVGNSFKAGDKVRIIRGNLLGLEGVVLDMKNAKSELLVSLNVFGCARLIIDTVNLVRI